MERAILACSLIDDDLIGTENGSSMSTSDLEEDDEARPPNIRTRSRSHSSTVTRQYPPPMNRNPWVLTREYCNGRLIAKAERSKLHQHFEVERENGRLVIALIVSEEDGEEERDLTCSLDVPMASCVVQDPPPSRNYGH